MRFNPTLTLCAALLLFALTNHVEAQTESSRRTSSNWNLNNGETSSRVQSATTPTRQPTRVAMRTTSQPKRAHESPVTRRLIAPAINSAAFDVGGNFATALSAANETSATSQNALAQPHVAGRVFVDLPQVHATKTIVADNPAQFIPDAFAQPMPRRNFFGIDKDQCCDEWDGFSNCGALKANPGHYGLKWLHGNDPCETKKCRHCQSHKNKKACKKNCRQKCPCCD